MSKRRKPMKDFEVISDIKIIKLLLEETRRTIVFTFLVHSSMTVKQLADAMGKKPGTILHHVQKLREAGVDVTFDAVFRDLAPLDSLIQVAGRCNRFNTKSGSIYIVELGPPSTSSVLYSTMVYDQILIEQTRNILKRKKTIKESELSPFVEEYYEILAGENHKKDTEKAAEDFRNMRIESLSRKFQLIMEKLNDSLIICKSDKELIDLISKTDSLKKKDFYKIIRGKSLAISESIIKLIEEKIKPDKLELIRESPITKIWGVSLENKDWLYTKNGGLNLPKLKGSEKI